MTQEQLDEIMNRLNEYQQDHEVWQQRAMQANDEGNKLSYYCCLERDEFAQGAINAINFVLNTLGYYLAFQITDERGHYSISCRSSSVEE